jgi:hypothetical protein
MQEVLQRLLQGLHCQNEGCELLLTPLGADFPGACRHIGWHKCQAEEGGMAGVVAHKAVSLHPVVLCSIRGSAENLFPDLRKVGYLVLKDSQGDEEAI